jgi:phosphoglycerate dehydrogenase-like enzyme
VEAGASIADAGRFREMTFAVSGFGRIGAAVLERARPFQVRAAAYDRWYRRRSSSGWACGGLDAGRAVPQADILSLHSPLLPQTKHLVDAHRLR